MNNFLLLHGAEAGETVLVNPRHVVAVIRHSMDPKNLMARANLIMVNGMSLFVRDSVDDIQRQLGIFPINNNSGVVTVNQRGGNAVGISHLGSRDDH